MMLVSVIFLIISVLIQGVSSNFVGYTYNSLSLFLTIYPLITLLILNPYFQNKKKYFTLMIIFSLIIGITDTNIFIFNTALYIACYYISKMFHFFLPYNCVTVSASNLICIFAYHTLSFVFLNVLKYDIYSFSYLLNILTHSVIMTIIYSVIVYFSVLFISQKVGMKEVR